MGKFDKALRGEKPGERVPLGKRRKYLSVTDTKAEHGQVGRAWRKVEQRAAACGLALSGHSISMLLSLLLIMQR